MLVLICFYVCTFINEIDTNFNQTVGFFLIFLMLKNSLNVEYCMRQ